MFKINLKENLIEKKASLPLAKQAFGVISIRNYIYVVGGYSGQNAVDTCERYDILTN